LKPKKHTNDREVQFQETKLKKGYIAKKSRKKRNLERRRKKLDATHKGRTESKSEKKANVWFPTKEDENQLPARGTNREPNTNKH
jgi:hypothetical protein